MENLLVSYSKCIFLDHTNISELMTAAAGRSVTVDTQEDLTITYKYEDGTDVKQPEMLLSNLIDETVLYVLYNPYAARKTGDKFVIIYC